MIRFLIKLLCRHKWEYTTTPFGLYKCCTKCGKYKKADVYELDEKGGLFPFHLF